MCKYLFLLRLIYRHLSSFGYTILSRLCIGSGYRKAGKDEKSFSAIFFSGANQKFSLLVACTLANYGIYLHLHH